LKNMRFTEKEYEILKARTQRKDPKSQPALRHESLAKTQVKEKNTGRAIVSITSFRTRLLDRDNLYGGVKYVCDGLRYNHLIHDDTTDSIDLRVRQFKVKTRKEERTEIEVIKA